MPNLSSLANIPGYGAFVSKRQMNEQSGIQDLQEQSLLMGLKQKMQAQQQEQQLQQSLSASGGDLEAAMAAALKAGRVDVAAKLAPIIEARRKSTAPRVVSPGSQVLGPNNEVLHQAPFKPDAPQKPEAAPSDVRMIEYYNSLPEGDPRKAMLKKIIDAKTRAPEKTFPVVT